MCVTISVFVSVSLCMFLLLGVFLFLHGAMKDKNLGT